MLVKSIEVVFWLPEKMTEKLLHRNQNVHPQYVAMVVSWHSCEIPWGKKSCWNDLSDVQLFA